VREDVTMSTDNELEDERATSPAAPPGPRRAYVKPFLRHLDLEDSEGKTLQEPLEGGGSETETPFGPS
jgi:hypothetical protein